MQSFAENSSLKPIFASQGFRSRSPLSSPKGEERGDRERNPWLAKMFKPCYKTNHTKFFLLIILTKDIIWNLFFKEKYYVIEIIVMLKKL